MTKEQELGPAISLLEDRYVKAQAAANELLSTLNFLRKEAGLPQRQAGGDGLAGEAGTAPLTQIKRDTFYGKKQMTAMREYLEMRRALGIGPAMPREILDALKAGGYKFEAKSDETALIGLRALLRKANTVFHKLPGTSAYGLLAWYPNAKLEKDGADSEEGAPRARKRGRPRKVRVPKTPRKAKAKAQDGAGSVVRQYICGVLGKGAELTFDQIKDRAAIDGIKVDDGRSLAKALSATILGMYKSKVIEKHGSNWRLVSGTGIQSEMAH